MRSRYFQGFSGVAGCFRRASCYFQRSLKRVQGVSGGLKEPQRGFWRLQKGSFEESRNLGIHRSFRRIQGVLRRFSGFQQTG